MSYHLAHINIARPKFDRDSPRIAEFFDNVARINALAAQDPGFVWQFPDDDEPIVVFGDPTYIATISVWKSIGALRRYTVRSEHGDYMRRRREWFRAHYAAYLALWWIPVGHRPTVAEAEERLTSIRTHGATPHAFTFAHQYPAPDEVEVGH